MSTLCSATEHPVPIYIYIYIHTKEKVLFKYTGKSEIQTLRILLLVVLFGIKEGEPTVIERNKPGIEDEQDINWHVCNK